MIKRGKINEHTSENLVTTFTTNYNKNNKQQTINNKQQAINNKCGSGEHIGEHRGT
jgi:hypothetical protein